MSIETPSAQVSVWREPDWVRLWAGDAMTALGSSMGAIAFPLITFSVTGSIQTASVVAAVSAVAYIAGGPWAGWLVDRMDRRRLILVADALGFTAAFAVTGLVCLAGLVPWLRAPEPMAAREPG